MIIGTRGPVSVAECVPRLQRSVPTPQRQTLTQLHKDEGYGGGQRQQHTLGRSRLPGQFPVLLGFQDWELSHQRHLTPAAGLGTRVVAAPPALDKRARDIHSHTTALQLCVPAFSVELHPRTLPTALNSTQWAAVG